jgi:hypothetical protein
MILSVLAQMGMGSIDRKMQSGKLAIATVMLARTAATAPEDENARQEDLEKD